MGEQVSAQVTLGTFHSVCARLLRRHGAAIPGVVPGLDGGFSIFDTEDSRRMLTDIIKYLGIDTEEVIWAEEAPARVGGGGEGRGGGGAHVCRWCALSR